MMKWFGIGAGVFMGLLFVGILAVVEAAVQGIADNPEWTLPFSIWWGLIFCLPYFGWAVFASMIEKDFD